MVGGGGGGGSPMEVVVHVAYTQKKPTSSKTCPTGRQMRRNLIN